MQVPTLAPALARNQRARVVRRYGRRPAADGVRLSQYDSEEGGEEGEGASDDGGDESGGETSDEGDASVESE